MSQQQAAASPAQVFVVGCGRSGTTLIQSMLAAHRQVLTFTESHFFDKGFRRYRLWPVPRARLGALVRRFVAENALPFDEPELDAWCAELSAAPQHVAERRLVALLDECTRRAGKRLWVEKTPAQIMYLPWMIRAAPDARFVHVVRRAQGVVPSLHKASRAWGRAKTWLECAVQWRLALRVTWRHVGDQRHRVIFYEDVVANPELEARRLVNWLSLPWDEAVVHEHHQRSRSLITASETWKANNLHPGIDRATLERTLDDLPWIARLAVRGGRGYDRLKARVQALEPATGQAPSHPASERA